MAVVTPDFLAGLMTNFRAIFTQALGDAFTEDPLYREIATQFLSDTDQEEYGWMGAPPNMNEWKDVRQYGDLNAYDYSLKNKHYEGTLPVNKDTLDDDKYGLIAPRIRGLAVKAVRHINETVISKLDDGATDLAYDGTAMFSATRTIGDSGNIANLMDGAYSGSSAEILTALAAANVRLQSFKDDQGKPMGLKIDTIVCSPAMIIPIKDALIPAVAGTTRPEAGLVSADRIYDSPWIDADALDWYVLCTRAEVRPLIFQLRKQPQFVALDKPDNDHVFKTNELLYGVDDRFAVGYGDPRTAIKITDNS